MQSRRATARALAVICLTGAAVFGTAAPGRAAVTPGTLTLSSNQGPSTGGNTITATTPPGAPPFFPGVTVEFQVVAGTTPSTCTPAYTAPVTPTSATGGILEAPGTMVISPNRVSINVPGFGSAPLGAKYNVCVYSANNANGQLLAQTAAAGQYSIGAKLMLNGVWPIAGPSQGGTTITVYGNNFPTTPTASGAAALTATLGGLPLLNITIVSANAFTAVTPARSPSPTPVSLIVTSASGTTILSRAFTFANGVTVSPSTAPNSRMGSTPVDVQGIGFGGLNFAMTGNPDDKNAHIYLVRGAYDPTSNLGNKKNGEVVECGNVMIVSDGELVCTMNLQASLNSGGANAVPNRTITVDTHGDNTLANITPPLSPADQGERISGTGIAPGTTITQVGAGGGTATLSASTSGAATQGVQGIVVGVGAVSAVITPPSNSPTPNPTAPLSAITPPLAQGDVGRVVTGAGIPPGTTIVGLNQDGTSAYLSAQPMPVSAGSGSPSASTITISDAIPVAVGAYTLTVVSNGTVGAWPADPGYTQSVISGASTFTVSDF